MPSCLMVLPYGLLVFSVGRRLLGGWLVCSSLFTYMFWWWCKGLNIIILRWHVSGSWESGHYLFIGLQTLHLINWVESVKCLLRRCTKLHQSWIFGVVSILRWWSLFRLELSFGIQRCENIGAGGSIYLCFLPASMFGFTWHVLACHSMLSTV